ncbi:unnamed protein product [Phytomonas sp. Hart1]|nr:unnamed protein product [Phytomonas sp. Hart1]|eukprot:CCW68271.1 unnamed protein product [Phytomonas sp. isolate Hart1]
MSWPVREHRTTPLPPSLACRLGSISSSQTQPVEETHPYPSRWPINTTVGASFSQPEPSSLRNEMSTSMNRLTQDPLTALSCVEELPSRELPWHPPRSLPPPSYRSHIPLALQQSQVIYPVPAMAGGRTSAAPSSSIPAPTGAEPRRGLDAQTQKPCGADIGVALQGIRDSVIQQTSILQAQSELQQSLLHATLQAQENFDRVFVAFKDELRATREALVLFLGNRTHPGAQSSPTRNTLHNNTQTTPKDEICPEKMTLSNHIDSAKRQNRNLSLHRTNVVTLLGAALSNQSNSFTNSPSDAAGLRNETSTSHRAGSPVLCDSFPVRSGVISSFKRRINPTEPYDDGAAGDELGGKKKQQRRSMESETLSVMHLSGAASVGDEKTVDPEEDIFFM